MLTLTLNVNLKVHRSIHNSSHSFASCSHHKIIQKKNRNCVSFFDSHLTTCKSSRYIWAFLYLQNLCFSRSMMLQRGLQLGIMPKFHLQYIKRIYANYLTSISILIKKWIHWNSLNTRGDIWTLPLLLCAKQRCKHISAGGILHFSSNNLAGSWDLSNDFNDRKINMSNKILLWSSTTVTRKQVNFS